MPRRPSLLPPAPPCRPLPPRPPHRPPPTWGCPLGRRSRQPPPPSPSLPPPPPCAAVAVQPPSFTPLTGRAGRRAGTPPPLPPPRATAANSGLPPRPLSFPGHTHTRESLQVTALRQWCPPLRHGPTPPPARGSRLAIHSPTHLPPAALAAWNDAARHLVHTRRPAGAGVPHRAAPPPGSMPLANRWHRPRATALSPPRRAPSTLLRQSAQWRVSPRPPLPVATALRRRWPQPCDAWAQPCDTGGHSLAPPPVPTGTGAPPHDSLSHPTTGHLAHSTGALPPQ